MEEGRELSLNCFLPYAAAHCSGKIPALTQVPSSDRTPKIQVSDALAPAALVVDGARIPSDDEHPEAARIVRPNDTSRERTQVTRSGCVVERVSPIHLRYAVEQCVVYNNQERTSVGAVAKSLPAAWLPRSLRPAICSPPLPLPRWMSVTVPIACRRERWVYIPPPATR